MGEVHTEDLTSAESYADTATNLTRQGQRALGDPNLIPEAAEMWLIWGKEHEQIRETWVLQSSWRDSEGQVFFSFQPQGLSAVLSALHPGSMVRFTSGITSKALGFLSAV